MSERINFTQEPLPIELAKIEANLAKLSLPASSINRDELLYHAGWAAAEAKFSHRQQGSISHWLWPATSAALAATILFLLFAPISAPGFAGGLPGEQDTNQIVDSKTHDSKPSKIKVIADQGTTPRQSRGLRWDDSSLSLVALRHRPWMRHFDTRPLDIDFDETPPPPSKTSRELLRELLPELEQSTENKVRQNENHWNWPKQLWEALS